ncbi:hypothetical protein PR202_ga01943 [Eleusine coracana subsp. coracana]|uniref:Uncharacterized protein n=1 Tax=Eleusine coracana subsp. coracana TaxID=191504 RepID=A0AAV5BKD4_ELECO|nr:hypothetical protein PR202_ga01256 [Eleusine coracana subsp. coracana]GJM86118.1 hypothetical protein PR202_ga01943 [Eleusine coracana subsp. coracana]
MWPEQVQLGASDVVEATALRQGRGGGSVTRLGEDRRRRHKIGRGEEAAASQGQGRGGGDVMRSREESSGVAWLGEERRRRRSARAGEAAAVLSRWRKGGFVAQPGEKRRQRRRREIWRGQVAAL